MIGYDTLCFQYAITCPGIDKYKSQKRGGGHGLAFLQNIC